MHVSVHVFVCAYMFMCVRVCVHTRVHVWVHRHVCLGVCTCVCVVGMNPRMASPGQPHLILGTWLLGTTQSSEAAAATQEK